jgi:hypothetical protein
LQPFFCFYAFINNGLLICIGIVFNTSFHFSWRLGCVAITSSPVKTAPFPAIQNPQTKSKEALIKPASCQSIAFIFQGFAKIADTAQECDAT